MLTPLDIESKVFQKSVRGYSVQEVRGFMKEILEDYEKMYRENIELTDKLHVLNEGIQYYKTIEETLQNTLVLAEKTAEETKQLARQKAEQIEKEAEIKAQSIINEAKNEVYKISKTKEGLIRSYDAAKIQVLQILKTQLELLDSTSVDLNSKTSSLELLLNDQLSKNEVAASKEPDTTEDKETVEKKNII